MGSRYFEGDGHKSAGWIPDNEPSGPTKTYAECKAEAADREREQREREQKYREERSASHWLERLVNLAVRGAGFHPEDHEKDAIEKGKECLRLLRALNERTTLDEASRRLADNLMRGGRL